MNEPVTFSRIRFDDTSGALRDGDVRYVVMRADGLMGAFAGSPTGLSALSRSVYEHGRLSVQKYQSELTHEIGDLLATIEGTAAELGWGVWRFAWSERVSLTLSVWSSPFAEVMVPASMPTCAPILGMFQAIAEAALGAGTRVVEAKCSACGAPACEFVAKAADVTTLGRQR